MKDMQAIVGSNSNRPVMILLELIGKKWVMRVLWELNEGSCTFRELQSRCGDVSPTMINKRLKELIEVDLVEKGGQGGYQLTNQAEKLIQLFLPLGRWAEVWVEQGS